MNVLYAYDPIEQAHTLEGHPEHKGRLEGTLRLLEQESALDGLAALEVKALDTDRLERIHPPSYVSIVERTADAGSGNLDPDTYVVGQSHRAALCAAGAAVDLVGEVMAGRARRGLSLMRPPGHHALASRAMGFCLFNNVAVAARAAQVEHGAERVLIVDFDVHHGNGTEAIFWRDPSVGFFSTHQYPFYPGTGAMQDIGEGEGEGATLNVPLTPRVDDAGYRLIFDQVLTPWARRFRPDLILVSAGFDAHWRDPLAQEGLSVTGQADLVRDLVSLAEELCDGRLVLALEGGYDLEVLPFSVLGALDALKDPDKKTRDPFGTLPRDPTPVDELVGRLRSLHGLEETSS